MIIKMQDPSCEDLSMWPLLAPEQQHQQPILNDKNALDPLILFLFEAVRRHRNDL